MGNSRARGRNRRGGGRGSSCRYANRASGLEHALNGAKELVEALALGGESFAAGRRQRVEARRSSVPGRRSCGWLVTPIVGRWKYRAREFPCQLDGQRV